MSEPRRILLLGDARMAFPVAKALAQEGHKVFAGVSVYSNYLEWSRHVAGSFRHAPLEPGDDVALPTIRDWLKANPVDLIQPVSEGSLRFLTRHRDEFEAQATLIMAPREAVETASNKPAMFALCDQLELPLAAHATVTDMNSLEAEIARIGFPLILKPATVDAELFGRKALICKTREVFDDQFPYWPDNHPDLIIQVFVSGPRHSVVFSAQRGRLLGAVEICAARTHEYDGTGYTTYGVTVAPNPKVRLATEKLVEALNYSTTGCTQFIVDPDSGAVTFMELNPRVSLGRIAYCAGLDHPVLGLQVALGEEVPVPLDPWAMTKTGTEYVWSKGDLNLTFSLLRNGKIGLGEGARRLSQIAGDAVRCHHAIFDPLDPLPSAGVYSNWLIGRFRGGYPGM